MLIYTKITNTIQHFIEEKRRYLWRRLPF